MECRSAAAVASALSFFFYLFFCGLRVSWTGVWLVAVIGLKFWLEFVCCVNHKATVSLCETNVRMMGCLLSAHILASDPSTQESCLFSFNFVCCLNHRATTYGFPRSSSRREVH